MVIPKVLLWMALIGAAIVPVSCLLADSHPPSPAHHAGLPIRFERSDASEFRSHGSHQTVVLKTGAATILAPSGSIRMTFPGSRSVPPVADDSQPSIANYFLGSNPANWRTNVPAYSRVRYRNLYPGIDLVFYGNAGKIEYDFAVSPGADPSPIRIALEGARQISLTEHGDLAIITAGAEIAFLKPRIYQDSGNARHTVAGRYQLMNGTVRLKLGRYDRSLPMIIDPALTYASFFGGTGDETAYAVATDPSGNMYIAGSTSSTDLPGATSQFGGGFFDGFVAKFSPAGALLYSTYLGGSGDEQAYGLAVDSQGNAYMTGYTTSTNFPVTQGAYGGRLIGSRNAFVAKLNPAGTSLLYSSYLGGSGSDTGYGIAVDGSGDMFITGSTSSTNFPVSAGAYRGAYSGGSSDAFVTALNTSGSSLLYSTYLGGSDQDQAYAIALDARGDAYVAGETLSADFPNTPGLIQAAENGSYDGFVAALNPSGTALIYSTFLGGTLDDYACGIAVDSSGNAYVSGYTGSTNFPHTSGVLQPGNAGGYDAFVTKINPSGTALVYSTYLGGSGDDYALPIAVDSGGNAYITGDTTSTDFPITADAAQSSALGAYAAFVAVLNSDASALWYGTYLGGSASQTGWGIALSPTQQVIAVGYTASSDFPVTTNAFQATLAGATDAFVAEFSAVTLPMLSIAKTHTGNFTQGQTGATYSVIVSNSATTGQTSGAVTVTEIVPAGLTLASMAGTGWSCPAGGNTCTRNGPLSAGSAYPPITVTVNVSQTVANQVTNQVSVAGGGAPVANTQDITSISLQTQTITFGPLANQALGTAPFPVSANSSSGLPVSFASTTSSVCTVSSATVTLVAIGTCTIQATQLGNTNYTAASSVNQSFTVTAAIAVSGTASLSFANTIVGKSSATQTVTLQNSGNAALTITSIGPTGSDAADYQYAADPVHPCPISPATLGAGATCTLDVAFVPVSQGSHNNAQIAITDNSGNMAGATQTLGLAGTAIVLSSIAVSANSMSLVYNNTEQFTATGTYSDTSTADLTSQVVWSSSPPGVATVSSSGLATAVAAGQTNITATQSGVTSNSFQLTVLPGTPASISVSSGSGQSATVGMAFAGQLQALVKDGGDDAVPNASVTFTAPSNGASGTFANGLATYTTTTNGSGIATSLTLTANATAGSYSVTAAVTGVTTTASFSLTNLKVPVLAITEAPAGTFVQGQNAVYTVTVGNAAGAGPTSGTVTVTEAVPNGLTLMGMSSGTTWSCTLLSASCTTNTVLNPGSKYPSITVTLSMPYNAPASVSNQVSASGGDSATTSVAESTPVLSACDISQDGNTNVADIQQIINEVLGVAPAVNDLNGDAVVNVLDVHIVINAVLGLGCSAS
jgi:hypothetical protein